MRYAVIAVSIYFKFLFFPTRGEEKCLSSSTGTLNYFQTDYDYRIRPHLNAQGPLLINVSLWIYSIGPISEADMSFRMDFYFTQDWQDDRVYFIDKICNGSREEYAFPKAPVLPSIWRPDTYFPSALDSQLHDSPTPNVAMWVSGYGKVSYGVRMTLVSKCHMQFHYFPFDIQSCTVSMLSYANDKNEVEYRWSNDKGIHIEDISIAQFSLITHKKNETRTIYHHGEYSSLSLTLVFKRHVGYYLIQTIIPSILCVGLSWVSFWIKRDATPARASLGITTVLAVVTLIASDSWSLPRISTIKAIEVYLFICLLFVFGALIEFSAVCYFNKPRYDFKKQAEENYAMVDINDTTNIIDKEERTNKSKMQFAGFDVGKIDVCSRIGFPLVFALINLIYWASYMSITAYSANKHINAD